MFLSDMFDKIVSDSVQMLIILFWTTLAFIIIWGALWTRANKKTG